MADIKTMNHNILMLNRFFDVFGIYPHSAKNNKHIRELILYGTMAAKNINELLTLNTHYQLQPVMNMFCLCKQY